MSSISTKSTTSIDNITFTKDIRSDEVYCYTLGVRAQKVLRSRSLFFRELFSDNSANNNAMRTFIMKQEVIPADVNIVTATSYFENVLLSRDPKDYDASSPLWHSHFLLLALNWKVTDAIIFYLPKVECYLNTVFDIHEIVPKSPARFMNDAFESTCLICRKSFPIALKMGKYSIHRASTCLFPEILNQLMQSHAMRSFGRSCKWSFDSLNSIILFTV